MSERDQIAAILGVMYARGTIESWSFVSGSQEVLVGMRAVTRRYTFLQFWSLFRAGEQAICCGATTADLVARPLR